jgi:hypothetical protein
LVGQGKGIICLFVLPGQERGTQHSRPSISLSPPRDLDFQTSNTTMKPTSPLSLLLFLSLSSAAPIPSKDCPHHSPCQSWLHTLFSSISRTKPPPNPYRINDHTPSTRISEPHFPENQYPTSYTLHEIQEHLKYPIIIFEDEEPIDNTPIYPSHAQSPSEALALTRPLPSAYLLSLSSSAQNNPPQNAPHEPEASSTLFPPPSKPTSSLSELRQSDSARYWASLSIPISIQTQHLAPQDVTSDGQILRCWKTDMRGPMFRAREYSDLLVVGIVVVFLCAVVLLEAVEYFGDL